MIRNRMKAPHRFGFIADDGATPNPREAVAPTPDPNGKLRRHVPAVEAGRRALLEKAERELARHNPVSAGILVEFANDLERHAAELGGGKR